MKCGSRYLLLSFSRSRAGQLSETVGQGNFGGAWALWATFLGIVGNFGGYCGKTGTMGGKLGKQHTYVVSGEVGAYIFSYCRSLTKVKFSTDQVRPALGSDS